MNIVADTPAGEIGMDSELGILSWIIFGTLAGWVATMIAGIAQEHGWMMPNSKTSSSASSGRLWAAFSLAC